MLFELILFFLLGILAGTFTGLVPGIHTNLVGIILVALSVTYLSSTNSIFLVIFIVAMTITHTFVDFIPSVFLGCPDTDTELSVLPGHELLKDGKGYEAVMLTCYGGLAAIIILILISFPSIKLLSATYETLEKFIPYVLILISASLILLENKKLNALLVLMLTGFLGWSVSNFQNLEQPLLPLLTGLFGSSMLIHSIKNKTQIPKQEITNPKINLTKPLLGALVASPLCGFLPGLGSGQAAIIGSTLIK
ncbi:MAG: tripartite tricarboxylate transporter permease, partial [Nanoarchaeota archaeon]